MQRQREPVEASSRDNGGARGRDIEARQANAYEHGTEADDVQREQQGGEEPEDAAHVEHSSLECNGNAAVKHTHAEDSAVTATEKELEEHLEHEHDVKERVEHEPNVGERVEHEANGIRVAELRMPHDQKQAPFDEALELVDPFRR